MSQLEIKNLHVNIEGKEILKGLDLTVEQGKIHAIMGPNGTGKSTLAYTLMGHPSYTVTEGEVHFKGQNVLELEPDERSRLGIFLAFQYPVAIPGVTVANFLRTAINARRRAVNPEDKGMPIPEFRKLLKEKMASPANGSDLCRSLSQRRFFRWREKARRDPADGSAQA